MGNNLGIGLGAVALIIILGIAGYGFIVSPSSHGTDQPNFAYQALKMKYADGTFYTYNPTNIQVPQSMLDTQNNKFIELITSQLWVHLTFGGSGIVTSWSASGMSQFAIYDSQKNIVHDFGSDFPTTATGQTLISGYNVLIAEPPTAVQTEQSMESLSKQYGCTDNTLYYYVVRIKSFSITLQFDNGTTTPINNVQPQDLWWGFKLNPLDAQTQSILNQGVTWNIAPTIKP